MRLLALALLTMTGTAAAGDLPLIVAHRGASKDAPENTLAAFRLAWEQAADAIEGDFHLTADGQILCFHDFDTKKSTGEKHVIAESTASVLQGLDISGESMPRFADVLATVPDGGRIYVEVKCGPEIVEPMFALLDASGLRPDQIVVISFREDVIAKVKAERPGYVANWLCSTKPDALGRAKPSVDTILATLKRTGADGCGSNAHQFLDVEWVSALAKEGFATHVWTVDDPALAKRLAEIGVDSITTNVPAVVRRALEAE